MSSVSTGIQQKKWEKEWRLLNLTGLKKKTPSHALLKFLSVIHPKLKGSSIIELGCGNGRNLSYLAGRGALCVGIDFVRKAIARCKENIRKAKLADSVRVMYGDMGGKLLFSKESFDIAFDLLSGCSLFGRAWETYKKEVHRILKPGGYFVVYYPNQRGPQVNNFLTEVPGPFPNSFTASVTGIVEKVFSRHGIRKEFPNLKELYSSTIQFIATDYRKKGKVSFAFVIFQKS